MSRVPSGGRAIPKWSGAPSRAARRSGTYWNGPPEQWDTSFSHVGVVWNVARGFTPDPLEFASRVAQHATVCLECRVPASLHIWSAVFAYLGVNDVVKAISRDRKKK